MIGGRSALLSAAGGGSPYGNWTGNYSSVSLLARGNVVQYNILHPIDESQSVKTITRVGSACAIDLLGKYGGDSLRFDGTNSVLTIPYNTAFNLSGFDFTIEMWIRQNTQTIQTPLSYNQGIGGGYRIDIVYGNPGWYINSSTAISSTTNLTLKTWHHLAVCRSGSTTRMFLDGIQVGSTTATFSDPSTNPTLRIGALGEEPVYYPLNGYIDDLRVTKGVARYVSNFTPPASELPADTSGDPDFSSVSLLLRGNGTVLSTGENLIDESFTTKELIITGSATVSSTVWKYASPSLAFDGSNSVISSPYNTAFNLSGFDFTIEMWIRQNTQTAAQTPLSYNQGIGGGYRIDIVYGNPGWYINSSTAISSTTNLTLKTWHHLAVCRSGSTTRMFLDGIQVGSTTAVFSDPTGAPFLRIGALADIPSFYYPLNGYIDDLRITKGVARYTKNFLPPPAELPAI